MSTELQHLQAQLRELNLQQVGDKKDEKQAYLAAVREHVALYGITEDTLLRAAGFAKSLKRRAPAKYYDPSSGKEWSGLGPRPKWLEGKNPDDYLIGLAATNDGSSKPHLKQRAGRRRWWFGRVRVRHLRRRHRRQQICREQ